MHLVQNFRKNIFQSLPWCYQQFAGPLGHETGTAPDNGAYVILTQYPNMCLSRFPQRIKAKDGNCQNGLSHMLGTVKRIDFKDKSHTKLDHLKKLQTDNPTRTRGVIGPWVTESRKTVRSFDRGAGCSLVGSPEGRAARLVRSLWVKDSSIPRLPAMPRVCISCTTSEGTFSKHCLSFMKKSLALWVIKRVQPQTMGLMSF